MFHNLWFVSISVLVGLFALPAFAAPNTISPGNGIGRIHLGELLDQVEQTIGREPDGGDAASGQAINAWFTQGKRVTELEIWTSYYADFPGGRPNTRNRALVQQVRVTSPYFRTLAGLGVGSRWQELTKAFAKAKQVRYFINSENSRVDLYDDSASGIAFEVIRRNKQTAEGNCSAVLVHAKDGSVLSTGLWFYPHQDGKPFDESYLKAMTHGALSTGSNNAKPYWSQSKSYWTPENCRRLLKQEIRQADTVRIYGGSELWHALTGLPTDKDIIKRSRLDPEAHGIVIHNKQLARLFLGCLRYSDNRLMGTELSLATSPADTLAITFSTDHVVANDDVMFMWWRGKTYCYRPSVGFLAMSSGDGTRFKNFVSQLARDAKAHRRGVSFFRYNVYGLNPT